MLDSQLENHNNIVKNEFGKLDNNQINRKLSPNEWSIGQCLHHLIKSNEKYIPAFTKVALGKHKNSFWEEHNPLTAYTGRKMIKSLGPEIIKKYKTPLIFSSPGNSYTPFIVDEFIVHNNELAKIFRSIENTDRKNCNISSPVTPLITLNIMDALNIIVVHELRHINQAIKIKELLEV